MTSIRHHIQQSPHRNRLERLLREILPTLSGAILDIGSRNRRYDHLLQSRPVAIDLSPSEQYDVVEGDIRSLSFPDASFDAVLCLEVLEYVTDPVRAISEIHRVLRPQGMVVLSVPFLFKEHEDMQRYTSAYLKELFRDFSIERFETVGGAGTVIRTILWGIGKRMRWRVVRYFIMLLLLPWLLLQSRLFRPSDYASGYVVVARKQI